MEAMVVTTVEKEHKHKFLGNTTEYVIKKLAYCCDDMIKAFNEKFIGHDDFESDYMKTSPYICIYLAKWRSDGNDWEKLKINFCPFCGKEIFIIERKNEWYDNYGNKIKLGDKVGIVNHPEKVTVELIELHDKGILMYIKELHMWMPIDSIIKVK